MAAPDPKTQFNLSTGVVNNAHIITAGGDVLIHLALAHWLNVVSGGLTLSAAAAGSCEFTLRELEVIVFQMVRLNAAVQGRTIRTQAASLTAAADLLQDCLTEGMSWTVLGSVQAAVSLWISYGRRCAQLRPALWVWGLGQMMTLPPHAGAPLHEDIIYSDEITFGMLSITTGAPRGVAALQACLPFGYTPIGRRTAEFRESLEEVGDAVEIARPGFQGIAAAPRKAKALCAHSMRLIQADVPHLLIHVDAPYAAEVARI